MNNSPIITRETLELQTAIQLHVTLTGPHVQPQITGATGKFPMDSVDMDLAVDHALEMIGKFETRMKQLRLIAEPNGAQFHFSESIKFHHRGKDVSTEWKSPTHYIIPVDALLRPKNEHQIEHIESLGAAGIVKTEIGLKTLPQGIFSSLWSYGVQPFYTHSEYDGEKESLVLLLRDKKVWTIGSTRAPEMPAQSIRFSAASGSVGAPAPAH